MTARRTLSAASPWCAAMCFCMASFMLSLFSCTESCILSSASFGAGSGELMPSTVLLGRVWMSQSARSGRQVGRGAQRRGCSIAGRALQRPDFNRCALTGTDRHAERRPMTASRGQAPRSCAPSGRRRVHRPFESLATCPTGHSLASSEILWAERAAGLWTSPSPLQCHRRYTSGSLHGLQDRRPPAAPACRPGSLRAAPRRVGGAVRAVVALCRRVRAIMIPWQLMRSLATLTACTSCARTGIQWHRARAKDSWCPRW